MRLGVAANDSEFRRAAHPIRADRPMDSPPPPPLASTAHAGSSPVGRAGPAARLGPPGALLAPTGEGSV